MKSSLVIIARLYFIDVSSSASRLLSTNISDFSTSPRVITQADNTVFEEVVVYEARGFIIYRPVDVVGNHIFNSQDLSLIPSVIISGTELLTARHRRNVSVLPRR